MQAARCRRRMSGGDVLLPTRRSQPPWQALTALITRAEYTIVAPAFTAAQRLGNFVALGAVFQRQLAHTRRSTADIALEVGYRSEAAFGKAFRQHTGTTPARHRRSGANHGVESINAPS